MGVGPSPNFVHGYFGKMTNANVKASRLLGWMTSLFVSFKKRRGCVSKKKTIQLRFFDALLLISFDTLGGEG